MRIYYEFLTSVRVIEFNIVPKLPSLYANLGCWGGGKASLLGHIFSYSNFLFHVLLLIKKVPSLLHAKWNAPFGVIKRHSNI